MKNFEEIVLNEFITRFNVSPDKALWSDEVLEEWLKIIYPAITNGTKEDKKELLKLYKSEVIIKGKQLWLEVIDYMYDINYKRKFFIYAD